MTRRSNSLAGQILAVNVLLVVATLVAASAAASMNLQFEGQRWQFLLLAMTIILLLLVNMMMLRRRFSPLERLIEQMEQIDPAQPAKFDDDDDGDRFEEVDRLAASFRRMLRRIESERNRSGLLVLRAQEEERRRLAYDLHDEVNQALTAILLRLQALSHDAPPAMADELSELKRLVNQAMNELLQLARQLRPSALDDHGLLPAIESHVRRFAQQTGIETGLETDAETRRLEPDQEIAVYRIAQEALTNIARHADASRVQVAFGSSGDGIELTVKDDGRGFETNGDGRRGLGLDGMAERARLLGGELTIDSSPGDGTALKLRVP